MILSAGLVIAGKFRLDRPLAEGGMGSVWVGFNTHLEVPVAIKFMAPSMVGSPELVARFEREAKAAAQLRNPHVVQIFEHGVDHETPFIVMELLEGEDLGARIRERGRLSLEETSRILADVCKALRRAHQIGLVHRDLKPANIFLAKHEDEEIVKVLDFGIAKSVSPSVPSVDTRTGEIVGSPHYMSPEQARRSGKVLDHRADLWALGVIAYRCITGQHPFTGDDMIEILLRVCSDDAAPPSSLVKEFSLDVDRFFERAFAREPADRFQSAREFSEALRKLAAPMEELPPPSLLAPPDADTLVPVSPDRERTPTDPSERRAKKQRVTSASPRPQVLAQRGSRPELPPAPPPAETTLASAPPPGKAAPESAAPASVPVIVTGPGPVAASQPARPPLASSPEPVSSPDSLSEMTEPPSSAPETPASSSAVPAWVGPPRSPSGSSPAAAGDTPSTAGSDRPSRASAAGRRWPRTAVLVTLAALAAFAAIAVAIVLLRGDGGHAGGGPPSASTSAPAGNGELPATGPAPAPPTLATSQTATQQDSPSAHSAYSATTSAPRAAPPLVPPATSSAAPSTGDDPQAPPSASSGTKPAGSNTPPKATSRYLGKPNF